MKAMKKMIVLLSAVFFVCTLNITKAQKPEWKEMKDFHGIMAKTFHPAEKGDFRPLKENAGQLAASAKAWAASPIPKGFNKELTPKILSKLVKKCEDLESSVKAGAADEVLKKKITGAHKVFHEVAEKCTKPGEGEGNEHHEGHDH